MKRPPRDFAASFEPAQGAEDLAPGHRDTLAGHQLARDDAVAVEQDAGDGFGVLVGEGRVGFLGDGRGQRRPATRRALADEDATAAVAGAARASASAAGGARELAEALEAVGMSETGGDQFAQAVLDVGGDAARAVDEFVEEERAAFAEQAVDLPRRAVELVGRAGRGWGARIGRGQARAEAHGGWRRAAWRNRGAGRR